MSNDVDHSSPVRKAPSNTLVAGACAATFLGMIGMAYAAVPLYQLFCQVTGYGGTTQRVEQYSDTVIDRPVTVRFDANVASGLPWDFRPDQRSVTMKMGETVQVSYRATNPFDRATRGRASFNVSPAMAGAYFNKVECFCFTDTELKPGETIEMPVVFFVDPAIDEVPELRHMTTITLSYTFFGIDEEPAESVSVKGSLPVDTGTSTSNFGG
ncbi:cytochrome c oxidase assembly protein [Aquibium sp. ELW1220]|jgi:cytochrome c oxidase assembly protein subunit 11|uniref:cytochrome c oxidase assembly protein n=1 Tax=Aquibium sp. ELW1220 TaxID=2976766 RepID=UPI0025B15D22|nr:cytochrome c oxidase assembly protein [Aquibium sp. ELW1220]MDN2582735.1 cytochrome c oxidase assembly protein [Aquibium sp. ELW1220]